MKNIKTYVTLILMLLLQTSLSAKKRDTSSFAEIRVIETHLCKIAPGIMLAESDSSRVWFADTLFQKLDLALKLPGSYNYPFDSLRKTTVSIVTSPDNAFRIFTFNAITLNGTYLHFGFLQLKSSSGENLFALRDTLRRPGKALLDQELDVDHWYGALYYEIIPFKLSGKKNYLLIGYDGSDIHSNKKVIEVLSFNKGEPIFGKDIFLDGSFDKEADYRVICEFHNESRMVMRYESRQRIVVIDKLAPAFPEAVNDYYYYIPSGDYDYYALKKGNWVKDALENLNLGQGKKQKKPKLMPSPTSDPQNLE